MLSEWETKAEIDEALSREKLPPVTRYQLERWRGCGLLPRVEQIPHAYRGSEVRYPRGTAAQAVEIQKLLRVKKDLEFVGWELWWRGFPVADCFWRPNIERNVSLCLRLLPILNWFLERDEREDNFYRAPLAVRVA